jgi:hypothetical protein
MKNFSKLDKVASSLVLICTVLIGLAVFLGGQAGIRVKTNLPEGGLIGPYQTITLTFSESVDPKMAEALFDLQPKIEGVFGWVDSNTLQFTPSEPFEKSTEYKLILHFGVLSRNGHELKRDLNWDLHVREPLLAYLKVEDNQKSIWVTDLNNGSPRRLTDASVAVLGFDASRDGEFVVFYALNEMNGIDLWRTTRNGESTLLLDCGRDRCRTPSISPDGTRIAYAREIAGPGEAFPFGSPRVWLLDITNGQDGPFYEDQQVLGYEPQWSPNGTQLASFDGLADQIRLLNMTSGEQFIFSSGTGGPITWSPDEKKFLFTDVEQSEGGVRTRVRMADLTLNEASTLIGAEDDMDYAYNSLTWSPVDDSEVLLGMRDGGDDPSQVLWLFNPARLDGIIIAGQPNYAYSLPHWNALGDALIFQQFKLKGTYKPEIGFWEQGLQEPRVIVEGLLPHWLP